MAFLLGAVAVGAEIRGRVVESGAERSDGFRVDVVVTDRQGSWRRHAVTDEQGGFALSVGQLGPHRVAVYGPRGEWTAFREVEVSADADLWVTVSERGEHWLVERQPLVDVVPGLPAAGLGAGSAARDLARGRDLAGAVLLAPGVGPAGVPSVGPSLLGGDPAAVRFFLDGFRLNDPLTGAPPWSLPLSLFGAVVPYQAVGWGELGEGGPDLGLFSRRPAGFVLDGAIVGGGLAPAGEAQGLERPRGWSGSAALELSVGGVSAGGRLRGSLALAPGREPWTGDLASPVSPRAARLRRLPVLGRIDAEAGGWSLTASALADFERTRLLRAEPVLGADDPASRRQDLGLLGLRARRPLGASPSALDLALGLVGSRLGRGAVDGTEARAAGLRVTAQAGLTGGFDLGGPHTARLGLGAGLAAGERGTVWPSARAGAPVLSATARAVSPFFVLDDVYRPHPKLDLEWGGRLEKAFYRNERTFTPGVSEDGSFSTGLFFGPRLRVVVRPFGPGSALFATAARQARELPLFPLLEASRPPADVPALAEDFLSLGGRVSLGAFELEVAALGRRLVSALEDWYSPATGRLELHEPRDLRRVYRAVVASLGFSSGGFALRGSFVRSSLHGTFDGAVDAATGQLRPGTTGLWDTDPARINHQGPLSAHRPWGARLFAAHDFGLGRRGRLHLMAAGRLDAGTPRSARARSRESGPGQLLVVERGSLGRTGWVSSVDAGARFTFAPGGAGWGRLGVGLFLFNLGQHRPVVARDPIFSSALVAPVAQARGQAGLAAAVAPDGTPVTARPTFGNPAAWAEPLRLDLVLSWQL